MKKVKKILIVIPIIAILICSICLPVSAYTAINMPISQPNVTDSFYYIEVVTQYDTGQNVGYVLLINDNSSYGVNLHISSEESFTITSFGSSSLITICETGAIYNKGSFTTGGTWISTFNKVVSITCYGNINATGIEKYNSQRFSFVYGSNSVSNGYLAAILAALNGQNNNDVINNQNQNAADIQQNADQNAADIQQNDDENTQAIIDNQNQLAEQEKQEVTDSGNDSVDGAMDVMPNYDLGDVFDGFINVMHYEGLDCKLDIPEIYIPSISNIFPKTVIYAGGEINFKDYFDMIPEKIILVVRAVLTVALIIFAFKELWTTIGQVLSGEGIKIMKNGLEGD